VASIVAPGTPRGRKAGLSPTDVSDGCAILDELALVARAISRPVVIADSSRPDTPIHFVNDAFAALTGYDSSEIVGRNCRFLQGADTDPAVLGEIREAIAAGRGIRRTIRNYRKNGEMFWNDLAIDPVRNAAGQLCGFIGTQYDGDLDHAARWAQDDAGLHFESIIRNIPGYIYRRVLKPDGKIELPYISWTAQQMWGVTEDRKLTVELFMSQVHPEDTQTLYESIHRSGRDLTRYNEEFRVLSNDGSIHWFRSQSDPRRAPGGDVVWDGFALDISAEKASEAKVEFLALHDPLTGLANRDQFRSAVLHAVNLNLAAKQVTSLFIVDLDAFQDINDVFGIAAGDTVLNIVGRRIAAMVQDAGGSVARLGGDEFGILLSRLEGPEKRTSMAQSLQAEIALGIKLPEAGEVSVQVCIGSACFPFMDGGQPAGVTDLYAELVKRADLALQAAKQDGPGTYREYLPDLDDRVRARVMIRQSLHRAIVEQQFQLHYQPIVNLGSGQVIGAEALVRWKHPELGFQRPDLFIPLAESTGLIVPLGAWIMNEAMRQQAAWRRAGLPVQKLAINVSSVELKRDSFIATVEQAFASSGADPRDIEFELTEGLLIEASLQTLSVLQALKSLGCTIAIDDFGTGHSTFKYLRDFHVDKIKIDQTFVRRLVVDSKDAAIIRAMIALSRDIGVQIVAEGIETAIQRDFLCNEGCETGQGYFFSMPLVPEDFAYIAGNVRCLPVSRKSDA
jgi:diguanylate cyclase (GGDEF)-like protein/PAS domain S-box-containing protein